MKKIMITGATGDVGKSLCDCLSASGYDLLTSSRSRPNEWAYPHRAFDITDLDAFTETLNDADVLVSRVQSLEPRVEKDGTSKSEL